MLRYIACLVLLICILFHCNKIRTKDIRLLHLDAFGRPAKQFWTHISWCTIPVWSVNQQEICAVRHVSFLFIVKIAFPPFTYYLYCVKVPKEYTELIRAAGLLFQSRYQIFPSQILRDWMDGTPGLQTSGFQGVLHQRHISRIFKSMAHIHSKVYTRVGILILATLL